MLLSSFGEARDHLPNEIELLNNRTKTISDIGSSIYIGTKWAS
jgi:hypothetical protein